MFNWFVEMNIHFQRRKKHMVVELQMYPGDKTPSTSVEDTTQYLPYKI